MIFNARPWKEVEIRNSDNKRNIIWIEVVTNVSKTNYIALSITERNRPNFINIRINIIIKPIDEAENTKYVSLILDKPWK